MTEHNPLIDTSRNFTEDRNQYMNRCTCCTNNFMGYKYRTICKVCNDNPIKPTELLVTNDAIEETKVGVFTEPTPPEDTINSVFVNEDGSPKEFVLEEIFKVYKETPEALSVEDKFILVKFKHETHILLDDVDRQVITDYHIKYIDRTRITWKDKPAQCRLVDCYIMGTGEHHTLLELYVPIYNKKYYVDNTNNEAFNALIGNTEKNDVNFKHDYVAVSTYNKRVIVTKWSQFWKVEPKKNINNTVRRIISGTKQGGRRVEVRDKKQ